MNKKLRSVIAVIGFVLISYSILAITGMLKRYKSPTSANEPNLNMNTSFFVSNLVNPKIGDFVCYRYKDQFLGKHIRVHKMCGMENDIIEIKNGIVHLNNINIDAAFDHIHFYKMSNLEYDMFKAKEKLSEVNTVFMVDESNVLVALEDVMAEKYNLTTKRAIEAKGVLNQAIKDVFKHNWNKDNFGPLKIPAGKIFVIGDNRDNSDDSRYSGFISTGDIVGVVVFNGN